MEKNLVYTQKKKKKNHGRHRVYSSWRVCIKSVWTRSGPEEMSVWSGPHELNYSCSWDPGSGNQIKISKLDGEHNQQMCFESELRAGSLLHFWTVWTANGWAVLSFRTRRETSDKTNVPRLIWRMCLLSEASGTLLRQTTPACYLPDKVNDWSSPTFAW